MRGPEAHFRAYMVELLLHVALQQAEEVRDRPAGRHAQDQQLDRKQKGKAAVCHIQKKQRLLVAQCVLYMLRRLCLHRVGKQDCEKRHDGLGTARQAAHHRAGHRGGEQVEAPWLNLDHFDGRGVDDARAPATCAACAGGAGVGRAQR